tara:strand:+ start:81 stop:920 length:840 start_codon:yes stop_codon:yes gene_type:complete
MPYSENPYTTGDIGENYVKYKLSQLGVDAVTIDRAYDLFLWKRMHRIEVKTSNAHLSGRHIIPQYSFQFKGYQTEKNAFDYAVCIGLDDNNKVDVMYIIPQEYIYQRQQLSGNVGISITSHRPPHKSCSIFTGNTYDKFSMCKLDLDLFTQNNKSAFTRKKNMLAKKLLSYESEIEIKVFKEFNEVFNNKDIQFPTKELSEKLHMTKASVIRIRKRLGIKPKTTYFLSDKETKKLIIKEWKKGHTRLEIIKILRISGDRINKLTKEMKLPRVNPYRGKK